MKVDVYDADEKSSLNDLSQQDYIGGALFCLHQVLRERGQILKLQLKNSSNTFTGTTIIQAEHIRERLSSNIAKFTIEGNNINTSSMLLFKLSRLKGIEANIFLPVYQSECAKASGGILRWRPLSISTAALFRDDENKPLQIELFEFRGSGDHKLIASHQFKFLDLAYNHSWVLPTGTILFKNVAVIQRASFLDYLFGGIEISVAIAIDFTGSNLDPKDPRSLHYINPCIFMLFYFCRCESVY